MTQFFNFLIFIISLVVIVVPGAISSILNISCAQVLIKKDVCIQDFTIKNRSFNISNDFFETFKKKDCFNTDATNATVEFKVENGCNLNMGGEIIYTNKTFTNANMSSLLIVKSCICESKTNFIGVIYSPYDKNFEDCTIHDESCLGQIINKKARSWWDYTAEEIRSQLELVSTKYQVISLYGTGTIQLSPTTFTNVTESLPIAQTPQIAAELNKDSSTYKIKVLIGAFAHSGYTKAHQLAEVKNAIKSCKVAESIFPGTVEGISIHLNAETMQSPENIAFVINATEKVRIETNNGIKVGVRLEDCQKAFIEEFQRTEETKRLYCKSTDKNCKGDRPLKLLPIFDPLILKLDFLICDIRPRKELFFKKELLFMANVTDDLKSSIRETKKTLEEVNPYIALIVETGWPSEGVSPNGSPNNVRNLVEYWEEIGKLLGAGPGNDQGELKGVSFLLFEAFDQPWKTDLKIGTRTDWKGLCGSEGAYGWWKREAKYNETGYLEKKEDVLKNGGVVVGDNGSIDMTSIVPEDCPEETLVSRFGKPAILGIFIASISFIILAVGLIFTVVKWRRAKNENPYGKLDPKYLHLFRKGIDIDENVDDDDYKVIALRFPYDKKKYELEKGSFQLDTTRFLGKGQSGKVYMGHISDDPSNLVAFKTTDSTSSILDIKNLLSEIKIMSYIGEHENIICLIGAYTEKLERGIVQVALEYCSLGSLDVFLNGGWYQGASKEIKNLNYVAAADAMDNNLMNSSNDGTDSIEFDEKTMVKWCFQISNGMDFLANKKVVHADLATRNILLTNDMTAKLTDFGLSRQFYSEIQPNLIFESDIPLPWRWMAPESLRKLEFSIESDVWSFGVVMWEIFSLGNVPFSGFLFCSQFITDLEEGILRLEGPTGSSLEEEICDLMNQCWDLDPKNRVSFSQLKCQLIEMMKN